MVKRKKKYGISLFRPVFDDGMMSFFHHMTFFPIISVVFDGFEKCGAKQKNGCEDKRLGLLG